MEKLICKPGDRAMVVRGGPDDEWILGKVVRVLDIDPTETLRVALARKFGFIDFAGTPYMWKIETPIVRPNGKTILFMQDSCLCPLAPPEKDEEEEGKLLNRPLETV